MILSEYERRDSPFVWIQFGTHAGDKKCVKTGIRKNDPNRKRRVKEELNAIERQLLAYLAANPGAGGVSLGGWKWAENFLATRYADRPGSFASYSRQWKFIRGFLYENEIEAPAQVTRELLYKYPAWRCAKKANGRRAAKLATAILGLKLFGLILDEALQRGLIAHNPARRLNIRAEVAAMRPEISDEMYSIIWAELQNEPAWMRKSFFLAINTGLRFATTRIRRGQVRPESRDILIEKPKGGRRREFSIPIYDSIAKAIDSFLDSGDEFFWTGPARGEGSLTGLAFSKFFRRSKAYIPGLCFHSTRITFISRGMRAGIPEPVMMKMVNHASKEISRIYQRWTAEDVRAFAGKIPALKSSVGL